MGNRIASLLELPPFVDGAEVVRLNELGRVLGVPQPQALQLSRRPGFPEPMHSLHRRESAETQPQPQPIWDRSELERWMKQQTSTRD
jgi:hypothetical protein